MAAKLILLFLCVSMNAASMRFYLLTESPTGETILFQLRISCDRALYRNGSKVKKTPPQRVKLLIKGSLKISTWIYGFMSRFQLSWGCDNENQLSWGCDNENQLSWGCDNENQLSWGCDNENQLSWGCDNKNQLSWGCDNENQRLCR